MNEAPTMADLARAGKELRPDVVVKIGPSSVGRVTGWEVKCSDAEHGTMPVLAPGRPAAVLAAKTHVEVEHKGRGTVRQGGRVIAAPRGSKSEIDAYRDAPRSTRRAVGLR